MGQNSLAPTSGGSDPRFTAVEELFREQLASGAELGASLAVDIDGTLAVDLWGGWADAAATRLWQCDTIVNVFSTTKTITALAVLILVDRGELDPFAPVAEYWPEFAGGGKEKIQVRHLLSHTSGVSGWDQPFEPELLFDARRAAARLEAQQPWWEPGSASGYHVATYGYLLGEVIRRVSGLTLHDFVEQNIAGPLSADLEIGASERDWDRIAEIVPPPPVPMSLDGLDPNSPMVKTYSTSFVPPELANTPEWRRAEMGASNGHANARSLVRALSVISRGGAVDGVRLLSPATIELIFQEQSNGTDLVLGVPLRFGIGYALAESPAIPYLPGGRTCFWSGWGGSIVLADTERKVTIGYAMNKMAPGGLGSDRLETYLRAIEACLA